MTTMATYRPNLLISLFVGIVMVTGLRFASGLSTDFGINVTSGANLTFTGFAGIPDSPPGQFNIFFAFVQEFPAVHELGVSGALLKFGPNSLNTLHSHPRGSEILFNLDGVLDLGLVDTSNKLYTATLNPGDVFVFPQGLLHYQINRDPKKPATAIAAFGNENAGRVNFPTALFNSVPRLDKDVVEMAFNLDEQTLDRLYSFPFPAS